MPMSGLVVLAFIVYHLLHFTALQPGINGVGDFSKLTTTLNGESVPDVYAMMILGFNVPWVALAYLVAQALLFMHLGHGLSSMFQSLGLRNHVWWPRIRVFAQVASIAIFLGYASIPVAILAGGVGRDHAQKAKAQLTVAAAGKEVVR
jgi:succinate dehydrogenase / fumarate reductase cytochrome b subunit